LAPNLRPEDTTKLCDNDNPGFSRARRDFAKEALRAETPKSLGGDCGQQEDDGVDGMAVTERGVGDVVEQRKDDRVSGERKGIDAAASQENGDAGQGADSGERGTEHQNAHQPGVRGQKILQGVGQAGPESGEALAEENQLDARMSDDEGHGFALFLIHERDFAHMEIAKSFALFGYEAGIARMFVVVIFVVADV